MGKFYVEFAGNFEVETEMPPEVYRAKMVHLMEKFLQSETRLDGSVEVEDVALTVATRLGYEPGKRYWEAFVGGHTPAIKLSAQSEWEAKEELRQRLGRRRLPDGTILMEVTGPCIQGSLL